MPTVAVVSFPGSNNETESMRALKRNGITPLFFRWNDDRAALKDVDGYFIPGGFSYEDRGRAGMVAARDPLMDFIGSEAEAGKVVIGNCNGAQILVESGLIPNAEDLQMSLARNVIDGEAVGFRNEWLWITPTCARDRCATSDWEGSMHVMMAHGEGRYVTKDADLITELQSNDQIAFSFCDEGGTVSTDPIVTPNGSSFAIAGICNPAGNVVALMPHPERTRNGDPYFQSLKKWIASGKKQEMQKNQETQKILDIGDRTTKDVEIYIDTLITNNEERTVEQALKSVHATMTLKQFTYLAPSKMDPQEILTTIALFNPNKERAFIRRDNQFFLWDSDVKKEVATNVPLKGVSLLRRDDPDTGAADLGEGSETGICYDVAGIDEQKLYTREVLEILHNPHASTLERISI